MISIILISCKKENELQATVQTASYSSSNTLNNVSGRVSSINANDVQVWLESQKASADSAKSSFVEKVLDKLKLENMYVESLDEDENLIIIPLIPDGFSKYINVNETLPLQYLLLVENGKGAIRRGDIVLFYPADTDAVTSLPENSFHDFFQNKLILVDGTFTLISLSDLRQYEMDFADGAKTKFRLWESKVPINMVDCLDWYVVTTYFNGDGSTFEVWEYLYTTCDISGGSGGSGGSTGAPELVIRTKTLVIREVFPTNSTNNAWWKSTADFNLIGYRYNNSNNNYFTSVTPSGVTQFANFGAQYFINHPSYAIWHEQSHNSNICLNDKFAYGEASGTVTYHNQPGPPVDLITNNVNWSAAIDLY